MSQTTFFRVNIKLPYKRMQSDQVTRYARALAADTGVVWQVLGKLQQFESVAKRTLRI